MTPEKRVQTAVIAALGAREGVVCWRNNVGSATQADDGGTLRRVAYGVGGRGAPDLLVEVQTPRGAWLAVWLEVKAPSGRLRPEQEAWHEAARRAGRHVYTVRSVDDALRAIDEVRGLR